MSRITRNEVDAEPSLRAPSGFAEVGVLTRRLAPGTTPAAHHTAVQSPLTQGGLTATPPPDEGPRAATRGTRVTEIT